MALFKDLSDSQLKELCELKKEPGFLVLQGLHDKIIEEEKKVAWARIDTGLDQQLTHATQLGVARAWTMDKDMIATAERELESRKAAKKKLTRK